MFDFTFQRLKRLAAATAAIIGLSVGGAHAAGNLHDDFDENFWQLVQFYGSIEAFEAYLHLNPEGLFAQEAREMLANSASLPSNPAAGQMVKQGYADNKAANDLSFPEFEIATLVDLNYAA